jgi:hypothetical protein
MKRLVAVVIGCLTCWAISPHAVQLTLDRRALEEAIYIGQSRIESERTRFHAPYRVRIMRPPIDWIDVITPFHRVELAAENNARRGGRIFSQQEALAVMKDAGAQIDLLIEMSFHPLNTFVAVPLYQVQIVLPGGRRVEPKRIERYPRFGPRAESTGPALPGGTPQFGGGQPVVGATILAPLDGSAFDPNQRFEVVVLDGKTELARSSIELGKMR